MSVKAVTLKQLRDAALKAGYTVGKEWRKAPGGSGYTGYWLIPPDSPEYVEKDRLKISTDEMSAFSMTPHSVLPRDVIILENYEETVVFDNDAIRVGTETPRDICKFVGENDYDAVREIVDRGYGESNLVLSRADIDRLMNGEAIIWYQGEYSTCIYFADDIL